MLWLHCQCLPAATRQEGNDAHLPPLKHWLPNPNPEQSDDVIILDPKQSDHIVKCSQCLAVKWLGVLLSEEFEHLTQWSSEGWKT